MSSDELNEPKTEAERRALSRALLLNLGLSAALALAGVFASSSALLANALDNASDAAVYAISLYATTRGARRISLATTSGRPFASLPSRNWRGLMTCARRCLMDASVCTDGLPRFRAVARRQGL